MKILWIDAQLPPGIAPWIAETFGTPCTSLHALGWQRAPDRFVFKAAKDSDVVLLTKDSDFPNLVDQHGPPPAVIWLTCGNTSQAQLRALLAVHLRRALDLIESGNPVVEIE